jgi:uncharacterized protein (PEP-CTERM system associated)
VNDQVVYIPPGVDPAFVYNVIQDLNSRSQPVKYQFVRGTIDFTRPRTVFTVSGSTGRERFQFSGQNLDRDVTDAYVRLSRRLRPNLTATIGASYYDRQFVNLDGGDENASGQFQVAWQYTSQIAFNFGYLYEERNSDQVEFSYKENAIYVGVTSGRAKQSMFMTPGASSDTPERDLPVQSQP